MNPSEAAMDPRLRTELWTSWASLLRSYAAVHGLNSRHHAVVEVGAEEITLRVASRWLRFTHETMESSDGSRSTFNMREDGTVKLNGIAEEMDLAAERLAREMMQSEGNSKYDLFAGVCRTLRQTRHHLPTQAFRACADAALCAGRSWLCVRCCGH